MFKKIIYLVMICFSLCFVTVVCFCLVFIWKARVKCILSTLRSCSFCADFICFRILKIHYFIVNMLHCSCDQWLSVCVSTCLSELWWMDIWNKWRLPLSIFSYHISPWFDISCDRYWCCIYKSGGDSLRLFDTFCTHKIPITLFSCFCYAANALYKSLIYILNGVDPLYATDNNVLSHVPLTSFMPLYKLYFQEQLKKHFL